MTITEIHTVLIKILPPTGWFIAGGSLLPGYFNDIDIYFKSEADYETTLAILGTPNRTSSAASTFTDISILDYKDLQLVHKTFGTPEEVLLEFDLNKSRQALLVDGTLYQHPTFHEDLYFDINHFRYNTIKRLAKYALHKKQTIDRGRLLVNLSIILQDPLQHLEGYYEDTVQGSIIQSLSSSVVDYYTLLAPIVLKVIESLPKATRLICYDTFITTYTEILPIPSMSVEQQLFTSIRGQKTSEYYRGSFSSLYNTYPEIAIPQIARDTYPEYFI